VGPGAEDLQGDADDWYPEAPGHSPGAAPQAPLHLEEVGLQNFDSSAPPRVDPRRVSMLGDVKLPVKIELGKNRMLVEDVLKLEEGSVVELDRLAGDPVAVYVNERLVARGEILILNDNFCVRISDVLTPDPHRIAE
jgi:flagellar motor switch protein FliN/FliY